MNFRNNNSNMYAAASLALLLAISSNGGSNVLVSAQSGVYPPGMTYNPGFCNICRGDQSLKNPEHSFTMTNDITWSCGYLQETVQSVNPTSLNPTEQQMCGAAQVQAATHGCECLPGASGVLLPDINDVVAQINPPCDMCAGLSSGVPTSKYDEVAYTTIIGAMNCKGLYDAMMEGVISEGLCPQLQSIAGPSCCLAHQHQEVPHQRPAIETAAAATQSPVLDIGYNSGSSNLNQPVPTTYQQPPSTPASTVTTTTTTPAAPIIPSTATAGTSTYSRNYLLGHDSSYVRDAANGYNP